MSPASEESRALTPGLVGGFAIIIVVLIATLVVGLLNLRTLYGATEMVAHTYAVRAALQQLLATAVNAETGERGFIITGTSDYLEPYERARDAIVGDISRARALTADDPEQQADLDRLAAATDLKMKELAEAIRQRRETGLTAAQVVVATNVGMHTMDGMRAIVARMNAREDALLTTRVAQAARTYQVARWTRVGTTALALLVVAVLFFATQRFGAARRRAARTAERLRVTLASIGDGVISTDDQGHVTQLNAVAEALTGWTAADAADRRLEEVFILIDEESRRPVESPIGRVLRENAVVEFANPTLLIAKDGREIPVDDSAAPIRTADGRVAGVVMIFRDVTERRRAERERVALLEDARMAKAEADHASRMKDEFLAIVSHELRTPLNTVLGWADMLRSGTLPEDRRERAVEAVHANAKRQVRLIDELLDSSRIMSGKLQLERTALDLSVVVRAAVDVVQPAADAKQVTIAVTADPSLERLYADPTRLQQIFWNLLSNAVKFTPDGGAVRVRLRRVDGVAECVVTDTGPGIQADFLPSMFEPFRQADGSTTRRHGGLGLGLSIVKHLVEAHGGTVRAESPGTGQGATFIVRLPIVPVPADEPDVTASSSPVPADTSAVGAASVSLRGISVLVADDDLDGREMIAASLEQFGAVVLKAASAAEALDLLQTERVHVLLADVAMPNEDGYTLMRKLRALDGSSNASAIPAAALTSMARATDRHQALLAGFQLHLVKPIDAGSLADAVMTLLDGVERV